ncbi:hypothetical protein ACWFR5_22355 [Streptomyces sp. NPDC055092]
MADADRCSSVSQAAIGGKGAARTLALLAAYIGDQRTEYDIPHRLACRVLRVSEPD